MSHTHAHNLLHCVFSTKQRQNLIRNPEELWRYVAALAHNKNIHVLAAGGTANHLHVLMLLPQTITLAARCRRSRRTAPAGCARPRPNFNGRKVMEPSASASRSGKWSWITSQVRRNTTRSTVMKKNSSPC